MNAQREHYAVFFRRWIGLIQQSGAITMKEMRHHFMEKYKISQKTAHATIHRQAKDGQLQIIRLNKRVVYVKTL